MKCETHKLEYVKRIKDNGGRLLNKQCLSCGWHDTKAYKISDVANFDYLPWFNSPLKDELYNLQRKESEDSFHAELEMKRKLHAEYLLSDKWRYLRNQALKRDNNTCQGCLNKQATDVHHMTYDNWGDELIFQLVSVCRDCHDKIHKDKR